MPSAISVSATSTCRSPPSECGEPSVPSGSPTRPGVAVEGSLVVLRPVRPEDVDELCRMFAAPEVAQWWGAYDRERIEGEMLDGGDDPETMVYAIEVVAGGAVAGIIQSYEQPDP